MKLEYFIIILLILLDISIPLFTYSNSCNKCIIKFNEKKLSGVTRSFNLSINDIYINYTLVKCLIKFDSEGYKIRNEYN